MHCRYNETSTVLASHVCAGQLAAARLRMARLESAVRINPVVLTKDFDDTLFRSVALIAVLFH